MEDDYYKILGVSRNASAQEIQKAYRSLARKYHPDLAEDKDKAKAQFQKVQQAYDALGDPEKRKLYDQYGPAFERMAGGEGQPFGGFGEGGFEFDFSQMFGGGGGGGPRGGQAGATDFEDILRQFAGGGPRGGRGGSQAGRDLEIETTVAFQTAVSGGKVSVSKPGSGESLTVSIPPGIESGKRIRLKGQGQAGMRGGPAGDLFIRVKVAPHPHFERRGQNLFVRVPISLSEAWLGGKIQVPTPAGQASVNVPPRTSSGSKLRLKGQGIPGAGSKPAGDLLVEVMIKLPTDSDTTADAQVEEIASRLPQTHLRDEIRW